MITRKIALITMAIFSIVILIAYGNVEKVYAITVSDVTLPSGDISGNMVYSPTIDKFVGITSGANSIVQTIHASTKATTTASLTGINSVALACIGSSCFTKNFAQTTLYQFTPTTGVITDTQVIDFSSGETAPLSSISDAGFFADGNTLYVVGSCDAGGVVYTKWTSSLDFAGYIGDCSGTKLGVGSSSDNPKGHTVSGSRIAIATSNGVSSTFQIWNTGGGRVCTLTVGDIWGGDIIRVGTEWLVTTSQSQRVDRFNDSCVDVGDVTSAQHGLTTALHFISVSASRGEYYIQSTTNVAVMNKTAVTSKLYDFSCTSDQGKSSDWAEEFSTYGCTSGSNFRLVKLDPVTSPTGATVCIDTTGDTQTDLCFTDTNGDGVADAGPAGALGALRTNANITNLGFQWNCAIGIGSCTDANPKTNGVGLIYLLVLIILSYAFIVFIHYEAVRMVHKENVQVLDALSVNPWLLIIMLFIDIGITFFLGWIPDLIFYSSVAILVGGVAGFGLYKRFTSGGN